MTAPTAPRRPPLGPQDQLLLDVARQLTAEQGGNGGRFTTSMYLLCKRVEGTLGVPDVHRTWSRLQANGYIGRLDQPRSAGFHTVARFTLLEPGAPPTAGARHNPRGMILPRRPRTRPLITDPAGRLLLSALRRLPAEQRQRHPSEFTLSTDHLDELAGRVGLIDTEARVAWAGLLGAGAVALVDERGSTSDDHAARRYRLDGDGEQHAKTRTPPATSPAPAPPARHFCPDCLAPLPAPPSGRDGRCPDCQAQVGRRHPGARWSKRQPTSDAPNLGRDAPDLDGGDW